MVAPKRVVGGRPSGGHGVLRKQLPSIGDKWGLILAVISRGATLNYSTATRRGGRRRTTIFILKLNEFLSFGTSTLTVRDRTLSTGSQYISPP